MIMAKYKFHTKDDYGNIRYEVEVDLSRLEKNLGKAQFDLDNEVMAGMIKFMPHQTGAFINLTAGMSAAIAGTGKVVAAAPPMGRFLYEGKTMVDEKTGSPWARKGAKKVLVSQYSGKTNARPNLTYAGGRQSHWFEAAKEEFGDDWIKHAKKTGGGK